VTPDRKWKHVREVRQMDSKIGHVHLC
jgi:hypothetical protein